MQHSVVLACEPMYMLLLNCSSRPAAIRLLQSPCRDLEGCVASPNFRFGYGSCSSTRREACILHAAFTFRSSMSHSHYARIERQRKSGQPHAANASANFRSHTCTLILYFYTLRCGNTAFCYTASTLHLVFLLFPRCPVRLPIPLLLTLASPVRSMSTTHKATKQTSQLWKTSTTASVPLIKPAPIRKTSATSDRLLLTSIQL